jgi:hypothetical protein
MYGLRKRGFLDPQESYGKELQQIMDLIPWLSEMSNTGWIVIFRAGSML